MAATASVKPLAVLHTRSSKALRLYIVAIAWMFVVVCMAAVEATTTSFIGGMVTLSIYGVLPLGLVLWLVGSPQRRRDRTGRTHRPAGASFTPRRDGVRASRTPDDDAQ